MKNLFKKIGALLVAAVMVLSMCTAVFAETKTSATITVKNADDATLTYAQVIKADQSTKTGWNFVDDKVAKAYVDAFGVADAQAAIEAMIPANNVDANKLGAAQAKAAGQVNNFVTMTNPQTVNAAGVYLIKATEEGYRNHQSDASDACSLCCDRNCDRGDPGCRYQFCSEQKTTQEIVYG